MGRSQYVEGDYIVSPEEKSKLFKEYQLLKNKFPMLKDGEYHIDIPFSENTQIQALKDAGFDEVNVLFRTSKSNVIIAGPKSA